MCHDTLLEHLFGADQLPRTVSAENALRWQWRYPSSVPSPVCTASNSLLPPSVPERATFTPEPLDWHRLAGQRRSPPSTDARPRIHGTVLSNGSAGAPLGLLISTSEASLFRLLAFGIWMFPQGSRRAMATVPAYAAHMSTTCLGLANRATCAGEHAAGMECLGQIRIQGGQLVVSWLGGFEAENSTFVSVIGRGLWRSWSLGEEAESLCSLAVSIV